MQFVGKIDKEKLGKYKDNIMDETVIITNERIEHIRKRHPGDYEKYINFIPNIIENPDYILEDREKENTVLILKSIKENASNIQIVLKLQTYKDKSKNNSIITFWHIRDRNYKKVIKSNKIIYKLMDKIE